MRALPLLGAVLGAALAACDQPPPVPQPLYQPQLNVELSIIPRLAAPGDTIHFRATAYNAGDTPLRITDLCDPSLDVYVSSPMGAAVSLAATQLGLDRTDLCEAGPEQYLAPRSSTSFEYWYVAVQTGRYRAWAENRWGSRIIQQFRSPTEEIEVR